LFLKERATRHRAELAEGTATTNAQRVTKMAEDNRQRLLRLQIDTGGRRLLENDLPGALPWFVEAFKLDRETPGNETTHQLRLASIFQQCPRPMQMFFQTGAVSRVLLSPSGRRALAITRSESATLWDITTGQALAAQGGIKGPAGAAFSPDGRRLVVSGRAGTVLWDLSLSPPAMRGLDAAGAGLDPVWNSAGTQFITASTQEVASVCRALDGRVVRLPHDRLSVVLAFSFVSRAAATETNVAEVNAIPGTRAGTNDASETALTVESGGLLRFWDAATGALLNTRALEPKGAPWQLACLNADGSRLITVHNPDDERAPSHARLWSVRVARPIGEPIGHDSVILRPVLVRTWW
jgi:WD40 repeat protein